MCLICLYFVCVCSVLLGLVLFVFVLVYLLDCIVSFGLVVLLCWCYVCLIGCLFICLAWFGLFSLFGIFLCLFCFAWVSFVCFCFRLLA